MSCAGCSTGSKDGKPGGCGSNGGCSTGGCNRLNTYDWLAGVDAPATDDFDLVEVTFKNGSRKAFFHNSNRLDIYKEEWIVVESGTGYDVGKVSLKGELVKLQLKKKKIKDKTVFHKIIRKAHDRDLEKMHEARAMEKDTMIRARAIARMLDLDMKVGDVEYQGDKRKATFFYTADGRVDFRELIRHYAKEFKVKIEMRQIGARQESARIGGLGACGRELCCSTWLTNFKSVSTSAARYQNLAINQSKLSGQCGRLKCCLNYELDTYMEVLKEFPKDADFLKTEAGTARLVKMDIFKRLMFYVYKDNKATRGKIFALGVDRVNEIRALNKKGQKAEKLQGLIVNDETDTDADVDLGFADVTGQIELPPEQRKRKGRGNRNRKSSSNRNRNNSSNKSRTDKSPTDKKPRPPRRKPTSKKIDSPKSKPNPKGGNKPTAKAGAKPKAKPTTKSGAKPTAKTGNKPPNPKNKRKNYKKRPPKNNPPPKDNPPKKD